MTSQEIFEKYLKAQSEYNEENSKFMNGKSSKEYDEDSFRHLMYLMGRVHALHELYQSACFKEEFYHD